MLTTCIGDAGVAGGACQVRSATQCRHLRMEGRRGPPCTVTHLAPGMAMSWRWMVCCNRLPVQAGSDDQHYAIVVRAAQSVLSAGGRTGGQQAGGAEPADGAQKEEACPCIRCVPGCWMRCSQHGLGSGWFQRSHRREARPESTPCHWMTHDHKNAAHAPVWHLGLDLHCGSHMAAVSICVAAAAPGAAACQGDTL